mmetsp:Transcript_15971/g.49443  ORF Transcript_15971/g.49443 Transcript_15971/m.49443 type:complete len:223 (+) Transcript_15971:1581-2249(+)
MSSGAMRPARAPASMAMFEMDMRASIDSPRIASPANSMAQPVPPAVPMRPQTWSTTSLDVTPGASGPSTRINMFLAFFWGSVWVARTCSTSDVPMPNASAPNAPCVAVCESPQTHVVPGSVKPCSGPMMWTMPWRLSDMPKYLTPKSSTFFSRASTCVREATSSRNCSTVWPPPWNSSRADVGTLWSTVASVQSGRRTGRPASRRPSKAWGLVTSWIRCRSM